MEIEIREPQGEEEMEAYFNLRYEQLRKPQGLPPGSERQGDIEQGSTHLIALFRGKIIGATAMIVGMNQDAASAERYVFVRWRTLAIAQGVQRVGLGSAMYAEVERRARASGAREIIGNARSDKLPFFLRLGFEPTGPGETVAGIMHTEIVKQLQVAAPSASPPAPSAPPAP